MNFRKIFVSLSIICVSAGLAWLFLCNSKSSADTQIDYIGNLHARKFHLPDCRVLPQRDNQVSFRTREEALAEGYHPCGICNP